MNVHTPEWVKHAIFYQIFPDRFAKSMRTQHPTGLKFKEWGSPPEDQGYQGGDLYGITEKLDYLQDLGVNALYLNPIFSSASNHRYHTYDYYQVDPLLGGNAALRKLLDEAHARGMRVVLDGVFNHASRGFWPFHHILENGGNSPYIDWFHVDDWPLRPYNHDADNPFNYGAWAGLPALPEFNTDTPAVREFLLDVARYWIDFGIDGWRLDVPNEINDDSFWEEFRRVVKKANPDAYIVGEIWHVAQRWLRGDQFDAVMNYVFTWNVLSFCGGKTLTKEWTHEHLPLQRLDAATFGKNIEMMHALYPLAIMYAQLNLLDSHDMPRALWLMGGDISAMKLAVMLQMTMPGAPCIYYGDELGMSSAGDPYCREAFPWHTPETWIADLLRFYQQATRLRNKLRALRTGSFQVLHAEGGVFAFRREQEGDDVVVVVNTSDASVKITTHLPRGTGSLLQIHWPEDRWDLIKPEAGFLKVEVPPREVVVVG